MNSRGSDGGPDLVQNGIALSATFHWMFERNLLSISDDYRLLVAKTFTPEELRVLFARRDGKILLLSSAAMWPNPGYLAKHRAVFISKSAKPFS